MRRAPLDEDICQTMLHTDLLVDQAAADEATKSWRSSARMPLVLKRLVDQVTVCPPFSSLKCFFSSFSFLFSSPAPIPYRRWIQFFFFSYDQLII